MQAGKLSARLGAVVNATVCQARSLHGEQARQEAALRTLCLVRFPLHGFELRLADGVLFIVLLRASDWGGCALCKLC